MRSLEARLRRLERARGFGAKRCVHGRSEADLDRQEAELRRAGFLGEVERVLVRRIVVSPPPRDERGNIIGPAPPPYVYDPEAEADSSKTE
jgi:hypothetical protein